MTILSGDPSAKNLCLDCAWPRDVRHILGRKVANVSKNDIVILLVHVGWTKNRVVLQKIPYK
jgi:hypothetical protein